MSDEKSTPQAGESRQTPTEAWQEVGRQFQTLGESLASALRTAWHDEGNRQRLQEMKSGLESMVQEVGKAIKETATSSEAQQARSEAEKTFQSMRTAGEQTLQEVRPQLLSALRQINEELQKLIGHMEEKPPAE